MLFATPLAGQARGLTEGAPKSVAELFADVPYEAKGALGSGYASQESGAYTVTITASGAAATPWDRLVAIAFARAAEIGLARNSQSFRITDIRRTADCSAWNAGSGSEAPAESEAPIFAGYPRLTVTAVYGPAVDGPDARNSAETFAEMKRRLDQMSATVAEKQVIVDWVFEYCASRGVLD